MSRYINTRRMQIAPLPARLILIVSMVILLFITASGQADTDDKPPLSASAWPPDSAMVKRLIATGNLEECLEYVKLLAVELEQRSADGDYWYDAEALARMAATTANAAGDYLGLIDVFTPMASSQNRRSQLAGHLILGAIFASGMGEFPTWQEAAAEELTSVVMASPFSAPAQAARSIARDNNIKIPFMPLWMWISVIAAIIILFLVIWSTSKGPRLNGRLALSRDPKSPVAPTISVTTFNLSRDVGKKRGLVFFVSDGILRHAQHRGDLAGFLAKREKESAPEAYRNALFAIFPTPSGHMILWSSSGGRLSRDGSLEPFFSDTAIEGEREIVVSGITLQFTGIRR